MMSQGQSALILFFLIPSFLFGLKLPQWTTPPHKPYNKTGVELTLGVGKTYLEAETEAYGAMARLFGVSVGTEAKGRIQTREFSHNLNQKRSLQSDTIVSAKQALVGVKVLQSLYNSKTKTYYVLLSMDKKQAIKLLQQKLKESLDTIQASLSAAKKFQNPIRSYIALRRVWQDSLKNQQIYDQLSFLSYPAALRPIPESLTPNSLQILWEEQAKSIGVKTLPGNAPKELQQAIEHSISTTPFRFNPLSQYQLMINYQMSSTGIGYGLFACTYLLQCIVQDWTGASMFSYEIEGKEGGASKKEAEKNALENAKKEVQISLAQKIENHLDSLSKG